LSVDDWIQAGFAILAEEGIKALKIDRLCRRLGVTKGSFYWHFDNRHALLDDILDTWERVSVDEVIERIEGTSGDEDPTARSKLERLGEIASSSEVLGIAPLAVDLAIRDWARRDEEIACRLRRVDNRRMDYMRSLFRTFCADEAEVEDRCMLVFSLWIGSQFIAADHDERSRPEVIQGAFQRLLDT
jgi:AcrR family transcriptional regulator